MGIAVDALKLVVVENTEAEHNVVVCTLCSCYPRNLLGLPPDWYKSRAYRSRAVREPRAVLAEFGLTLPETTTLRVHDSTADMRYLVVPMRPAGTEGWDAARLASIVTRDSMIGVATPVAPT
jgi:nitrile hydratase